MAYNHVYITREITLFRLEGRIDRGFIGSDANSKSATKSEYVFPNLTVLALNAPRSTDVQLSLNQQFSWWNNSQCGQRYHWKHTFLFFDQLSVPVKCFPL